MGPKIPHWLPTLQDLVEGGLSRRLIVRGLAAFQGRHLRNVRPIGSPDLAPPPPRAQWAGPACLPAAGHRLLGLAQLSVVTLFGSHGLAGVARAHSRGVSQRPPLPAGHSRPRGWPSGWGSPSPLPATAYPSLPGHCPHLPEAQPGPGVLGVLPLRPLIRVCSGLPPGLTRGWGSHQCRGQAGGYSVRDGHCFKN